MPTTVWWKFGQFCVKHLERIHRNELRRRARAFHERIGQNSAVLQNIGVASTHYTAAGGFL